MNRRSLLKWLGVLPFMPKALASGGYIAKPDPAPIIGETPYLSEAAMEIAWGDVAPGFFGWHVAADGIARVHEGHECVAEFGPVKADDVLSVGYDGSKFVYRVTTEDGVKLFEQESDTLIRCSSEP